MRTVLMILCAAFLIFSAWGCGGGGGGEEDGGEEMDAETDEEGGEVQTDPDAVDGTEKFARLRFRYSSFSASVASAGGATYLSSYAAFLRASTAEELLPTTGWACRCAWSFSM